jgi:hypothetical protein
VKDFRVVRLNTGESFMCVVYGETEQEVDVLFPLLIKTTTIPISENTLREVHSTALFCPFTDDKHFTFNKTLMTFSKPLGDDAIKYYLDMLNKHEENDVLRAYDLEDLISKQQEEEILQDEIDLDDDIFVDKTRLH